MAIPAQDADGHIFNSAALGLGNASQIVSRRIVEPDETFRIAGADRKLFHVHVRRVQQTSACSRSEDRQRTGGVGSADGRAFQRIDRDVELRPSPGTDGFTDIEHGSRIAFSLANDDGTRHRHGLELPPHRVDCGLVCRFLVATASPRRRRQRRRLGRPKKIIQEPVHDAWCRAGHAAPRAVRTPRSERSRN